MAELVARVKRSETWGGAPTPRGTLGRDKFAVRDYIIDMTIEDLEKAVAKLPPDQLAKFRDWFETFDAARFDQKIERDAKAGKLDRLAEQALADHTQGRAREL
jgi:hypothetical protein